METEKPVTVWALIHAFFTDSGCRQAFIEGWKDGWNADKTAPKAAKAAQSVIRGNADAESNDNEPLSGFYFRPKDLWDFPADAKGNERRADPCLLDSGYADRIDGPVVSVQMLEANGYPENWHDAEGIHDEEPAEVPNIGHIEKMFPHSQTGTGLEDLWKVSPEEAEESSLYYQYDRYNSEQNASQRSFA